MTMEPNHHPDDERLAAFAGGEPDVELRLHVRDCARCRSVVDELAMLRAALVELPDLAPSRPLQLLPPVGEPVPSGVDRLAGWTRRAFMPLLAAGFGLAIVGSVGTVSPSINIGFAGGAAVPASAQFRAADASGAPAAAGGAPTPSANSDSKAPGTTGQAATASPGAARAEDASASPAAEPQVALLPAAPEAPRSLWPMILFAGVALIVGTLLLRWVVQPRAG